MRILKGTCHNPGHDWKDGHTRGETVFVYSSTLPTPYAPGQHPRVGNTYHAATPEHFIFERASLRETCRLLPLILSDLRQNCRRTLARVFS